GVDVQTGKNLWKRARPRGHNWASPLLMTQGDQAQVVISSIADLSAYDIRNGKERWTCVGNGFSNTNSKPILRDGLVLVPNGNLIAVEPGTETAGPKVIWQTTKLHPNVSSPLYHAKRLYAIHTPNILVCVNTTDAKVLWQQRLAEGTYWSSPVAADGKIYAVNDAGTTTVVQTGNEPKILARNVLDDPILATPAIAGGCIFLRSDRYVYCVSGDRHRVSK